MVYEEEVSQEEWKAYAKQNFQDLERILDSTRPVGQQFYQSQHVWNNRMLKEKDVLKELQNNSIFATICSKVDAIVFADERNDEQSETQSEKQSEEKHILELDKQVAALIDWFVETASTCDGR